MKILIASALYPPDIAAPAPYIKELATRWSAAHSITLLVYGNRPETIPGVTIVTVPKDLPAFQRVFRFFKDLRSMARSHDVVLIQNAPATELPAAVAALGQRQKFFRQHSDLKIRYSGWRATVHRLATVFIPKEITLSLPAPKPIIHPFRPLPSQTQEDYEASWTHHLAEIETTIS